MLHISFPSHYPTPSLSLFSPIGMHRGKWGRGPWGPTNQHGHGLPDGLVVRAVLVIPVSKSRFPAPPARFPWIHEDRRTDKDERKEEVSSLERRPHPLSLLLCGCVLFLFNKFSIRGLTRLRAGLKISFAPTEPNFALEGVVPSFGSRLL